MKFLSAIAALSILGLVGCQESEPENEFEEAIEETAEDVEDAADDLEDAADPS
jgi:PBP1b-binding outer membrane lipoprotein LpoB